MKKSQQIIRMSDITNRSDLNALLAIDQIYQFIKKNWNIKACPKNYNRDQDNPDVTYKFDGIRDDLFPTSPSLPEMLTPYAVSVAEGNMSPPLKTLICSIFQYGMQFGMTSLELHLNQKPKKKTTKKGSQHVQFL